MPFRRPQPVLVLGVDLLERWVDLLHDHLICRRCVGWVGEPLHEQGVVVVHADDRHARRRLP